MLHFHSQTLQGAYKFSDLLGEAAEALAAAAPLPLPAPALLEGVELRPGSFNKAANNTEVATACNECVTAWCTLADGVVDEANAVRPVHLPTP